MPDVLVPVRLFGDLRPADGLWALCLALVIFIVFSWFETPESPEETGPSPTVDYFKLSGVPLPKPLHKFDLEKAKPRPYRPFRWQYHQTMCTPPSTSCKHVSN